MNDITVYTTRRCGYCTLAKRLLATRELAFEEVDVTDDSEARARLVERTGRRTVPQIIVRGVSIGGYRELVELDRSGNLARMLGK